MNGRDGAPVRLLVVSVGPGAGAGSPVDHLRPMVELLRRSGRFSIEGLRWGTEPGPLEQGATALPTWAPVDLDDRDLIVGMRALGLRRISSRLKDRWSSRWLAERRAAAAYLDGVACAEVLPWLAGQTGPVVWHLHPGEALSAADLAHAVSGPAGLHVFATDPAHLRMLAGAGPGRLVVHEVAEHQPLPAVRLARHEPAVLGVRAALDDEHGVDLLGRLMWELDRGLGAEVRIDWAVAGGGTLPAQVAHDLRRLGSAHRVTVSDLAPGAGSDELVAWLEGVDLVVDLSRGGPDRRAAEALAATGRVTVGLDDRFPDLGGLADAVVDLLARPGALEAESERAASLPGGGPLTSRIIDLLSSKGGAASGGEPTRKHGA